MVNIFGSLDRNSCFVWQQAVYSHATAMSVQLYEIHIFQRKLLHFCVCILNWMVHQVLEYFVLNLNISQTSMYQTTSIPILSLDFIKYKSTVAKFLFSACSPVHRFPPNFWSNIIIRLNSSFPSTSVPFFPPTFL